VGNYSQAFDAVWGWADAGCRQTFVFMCKIRGAPRCGHLGPAPGASTRRPGAGTRRPRLLHAPCQPAAPQGIVADRAIAPPALAILGSCASAPSRVWAVQQRRLTRPPLPPPPAPKTLASWPRPMSPRPPATPPSSCSPAPRPTPSPRRPATTCEATWRRTSTPRSSPRSRSSTWSAATCTQSELCRSERPANQSACSEICAVSVAGVLRSGRSPPPSPPSPGRHRYNEFYWSGLVSSGATWPSFRWQDKQFPAPNATSYRNWGTLRVPLPDGTSLAYSEPNKCAPGCGTS
jgi:hypothetical protein